MQQVYGWMSSLTPHPPILHLFRCYESGFPE